MEIRDYKRAAYLVMTTDFLHYIAYMCTKPQLKSLLNEAGAGNEITGVVLSLFSIVQVVQALFLSKLINKYGQKGQLVLSGAMYALAGIGVFFSHSVAESVSSLLGINAVTFEIAFLAFCTMIFGISHGITLLAGHYVVTGIPKEAGRDKLVGYFTFGNSIGQLVGPIIAAYILTGALTNGVQDKRYVVLASVVASVGSFVLSLFVHNFKREDNAPPAKLSSVVKNGPLMRVVLMNAMVYFSVEIIGSYMQDFGEKELGLQMAKAALILSVIKAASVIVRASLGFLTEKIGSVRLFRISFVVCGVSAVCMGLTKYIASPLVSLGMNTEIARFSVLVFFSVFYGLADGLLNPLSLVQLSNYVNSDTRSSALALRNMGNYLGQAVGENFFGIVAGFVGLAPVFWMCGGVLASCSFIAKKLKK